MIGEAIKDALQRFVPKENISYQEPMKKHTTFRVGGNAEVFIRITEQSQLSPLLHYLHQVEIPYFVMGNGSNLLVSDHGYEGIIIQLGEYFSDISINGIHLTAKAGTSMSRISRKAAEAGLTGLEFAAGIPGTVGGGVVMNAGAYDGEMKQVVESVAVLDCDGNEMILDNESMEFSYRNSAVKNTNFIITECTFFLEPGSREEIQAKIDDFQQRRKEKQPLDYPSAGSTFKRPDGYFAGKLITDAGLKGKKIGGAQVSEKHAGFLINTGDATASDIYQLIAHVQEEVEKQFNVRLEPEVIFLGEF